MEKIELSSGFEKILEGMPDSWGVFAFYKGKDCLLYSKSGNLRYRLNGMYQRKDSDTALCELFLEADSISFKVCEQPIMALLREKVFLQKHTPLLQHQHQGWKSYAYLAIDPKRFPFVSVKDDTNDSWQYLGPFRSRFFLSDVMDTVGRILKLPFCQSESFPCERLDNDICKGYCIIKEKAEMEEDAPDKLSNLLKEAYLHPLNGILELVKKERDRYFDNLEFDKVDLLQDEFDLLKKYRDWLSFLYIIKEISFENEMIKVVSGQIVEYHFEGKSHKFPLNIPQYRPNEALALNKDIVDECRIVYLYHKRMINK